MSTIEVVAAIFAIGVLSGLRALSPIAIVCWLAAKNPLGPIKGGGAYPTDRTIDGTVVKP